MTPPPRSPNAPKKSRRIQPKIVGHTAPSPRGPSVGGLLRASNTSAAAPLVGRTPPPAVRTPAGAPGMRGFPRARIHSARAPGNSVARALREQAEAATVQAAPEAELLDAHKPRKPRSKRDLRAPARPSVTGRPTTPDEAPMNHSPAADRPAAPLRTTQARTLDNSHRVQTRHRLELWQTGESDAPSRPRPSRVLAELVAATADEATAE